MDDRANIKAFLSRYFHNIDLQDEQDIFSLGIVNSLFAMQLVLFVEKEIGMTLANEDLDIDNFRSINAILKLIQHKTASIKK